MKKAISDTPSANIPQGFSPPCESDTPDNGDIPSPLITVTHDKMQIIDFFSRQRMETASPFINIYGRMRAIHPA